MYNDYLFKLCSFSNISESRANSPILEQVCCIFTKIIHNICLLWLRNLLQKFIIYILVSHTYYSSPTYFFYILSILKTSYLLYCTYNFHYLSSTTDFYGNFFYQKIYIMNFKYFQTILFYRLLLFLFFVLCNVNFMVFQQCTYYESLLKLTWFCDIFFSFFFLE